MRFIINMSCFLLGAGLFWSCQTMVKFKKHTPTGHTTYITNVNGREAYCNLVDQKKGCMMLSQCEDGSSYFCVQNVEMRIDK